MGVVVSALLWLLGSFAQAADGTANVVGGEPVPEGVWEDTAAIGYNWGIGCTGTLIAPDLVITAGHCNIGIKYVIVGTNNYDQGGERIDAIATYEYPNSQNSFDVTIVELEHEATVAPRTIASGCVIDEMLYDGAPVTIAGYGATDENASRYTSKLMQAFTTVGDHDCSETSRGCHRSISPGGELIAGGDGVDSCNGDSGGPLYLNTEIGDFLVGVTSRAAYPADSYCGDGGIYARPDAILDWIESETGRTLERPDCDEPQNAAPEPLVDNLIVEQGATRTTVIDPNDPDAGQTHVFAIVDPPVGGTATVDADGKVSYTADEDYIGEDDFVITVTDDGSPPMSADVVVPIEVRERSGGGNPDDSGAPATDDGDGGDRRGGGGCGCATGGASLAWALPGLALLAVRRRR